MAMVGTKRQNI